jgi:hypothetical protein
MKNGDWNLENETGYLLKILTWCKDTGFDGMGLVV